AVATFHRMIVDDNGWFRLTVGQRSVLSLVADAYPRWPALVTAGALANSGTLRSGGKLVHDLAEMVRQLGEDDLHKAAQLFTAFAERAPRMAMEILASTANDDTDLAAALLLQLADSRMDRAALVLGNWLLVRFPSVDVLAGVVVLHMVEIDPRR